MKKSSKVNSVMKNPSARRSQRRINQLLDKNISEYEIPNPYRNSRNHPYLPKNLSRQLSKLDSFSIRTLQNIRFIDPKVHDEVTDLLNKMRLAVQKQSDEFGFFVAQETKKLKKNSINTDCEQQHKKTVDQEEQSIDNSIFMPKKSQNSIDLLDQKMYDNLALLHHQSEGASMMSDNYQADKLIFHSDQNLVHQIEQPLDFYQP